MNRFSILRGFAFFAVVVFLAAGVSFAQTSNGTIAGTIADKTGGAVPSATVTASSSELGTKRSTTTDGVGTYRIESLPPGKYMVVVTAQGFSELRVANVDVRGSFTTTVNGVLEVAAVAATVTVEASGQELQTQSGELSHNISRTEINNLPFFSLNPISLVLTEPGVQSVASRDSLTNGIGFSVNGTRPRANNFLIDGQDNNDNSINGQAFQQINAEAIAEVTVLTNSYSAEFGRGGGSVTNVISKGGSNDWHGAAWELNRNSALAAIDASVGSVGGVTSNPVDNENTFGFSIGGPVKKNKLFFFGTSQWDRERSNSGASVGPIRIPTAAGVATIQSLITAGRVNANNANFLINALGGLRGDPAQLPANIALGNDSAGVDRGSVQTGFTIRGDTSIVSNDRQWQFKVDWAATQNDAFTARYLRDDSVLTPDFFNFPFNLPTGDTQQGGPSQNFGAAWVHTFSARAVNEFRFSFAQIDFSFSRTPATAASVYGTGPAVALAGSGFPTLGAPTGIDQGRGHKTYQFQEALSYTVGSHAFKFGGDVALLQVRDSIPFNDRGTITVNRTRDPSAPATTLYTSLANFLDNFTGASGNVARNFGNPVTQPFMPTYAPYIQDTWRLRPNFTVDLGLRYEYWGAIENILQFPAIDLSSGIGLPGVTFPGSWRAQQKGDKNNFAPRIGLAYTPRFWSRIFGQGKTIIRAGYGIFYDGLFTNILDNTAGAVPNVNGFNFTAASRATGCVPSPCAAGTSRGSSDFFGINSSTAPSLSPFGTGSTLDANLRNPLTHQWNLDLQRELPGNFVVTAAYVGTRGIRLYVNQEFNPGIINGNFGFVDPRTNGGDSSYHSAQLKVEHRLSKGFFLRGSYTFSRLIDDSSEVFVTSGRSSFAQDPFCQRCDRGLSVFHRKHRAAFAYVWELPYVHSKDNAGVAILRAITEGWSSSGTITFQTGAPQNVNSSVDTDGDFRSTNDRPNLADPTKNPWDINRYVIPASGLGNVGRNTLLAAGRQDWNLTVQRAFKMPMKHLEQQQLMFRAEFFNAFNHPNLGIPTARMDRPADFGNFAETAFGGRQIRLLLKYSF